MKRMISCLLVMTMFMATMLIALPMSAAASEPFDYEANKTEGKTADFYMLGNTNAANYSTGGFKETALYFDVTPGETYKIYINKLTTILYHKNDVASWAADANNEGRFANLSGYALDASAGTASPRMFVYQSENHVLGSAIQGYSNYSLTNEAAEAVAGRSFYANWWDRRAGKIGYTSFVINFPVPAGVTQIGVVMGVGNYYSGLLNDPSDSLTLKVESIYVAQDYDGVSATLGEDIALNYYAAATAGDKMEFTVGDETMTVMGVADGLQNKFTLHLAPNRISENIQAFLYNGSVVTKIRYNYSVAQYLNGLKAEYSSDIELCALADEILAYGAAAKDFVDQKADADALVDSIPAIDDFALNGNGNAVTFTSGNVFFDDTCDLIFAYNGAKAGVEWTVNDSSTGFVLAGGTVTIEGLMPTDFDTVYTVEASVGSDVTSAAYSVNAYCYAIANKAGAAVYAKNLAIATYNYGVAAEAYINAIA